jgi:hypothetical protein
MTKAGYKQRRSKHGNRGLFCSRQVLNGNDVPCTRVPTSVKKNQGGAAGAGKRSRDNIDRHARLCGFVDGNVGDFEHVFVAILSSTVGVTLFLC